MFEWSTEFNAWIITVDKDVRIKIEEIEEVIRDEYFIVRVNPEKIN